jgi:hypothetical protein
MTPENISAEPPPPAGMSEFSRLTGVFFEPKKAFEDVAARPRWLVPTIVIILSALLVSFAFGQHIGWDRIVRHQLEASSRNAQLTQEQRDAQMSISLKIAPIAAFVFPIIGIPIAFLIIAGVLMGIASGILSAKIRFKQMLAIVAHASLPGVISSILTMVVVYLKNPEEFNTDNPLAFNPGAFLDPQSTSKFVYSMATSFDLFTIWSMILMAIGIQAAAGRKLSFGGALAAVVIPWLVWVFIKAGLAGLR